MAGAPVGQTPILRHSYRHDRVSVISAITISSARQWIGMYFRCHRENINGERVVEFLRQAYGGQAEQRPYVD
jgi:hypothetical protein